MNALRQYAYANYPEQEFDNDFEIYLQVARTLVDITVDVTVEEVPHNTSVSLGSVAQEAVSQSIGQAKEAAVYRLAYERFTSDTSRNNRQEFAKMTLEIAERSMPLPEYEPTPLTAADRQAQNYVLTDAMRLHPRTAEGRQMAAIFKEFFASDDMEQAIAVDRVERGRSNIKL